MIKNTFPTVRNARGSILLWGWVAASGTGNIGRDDGRINSSKCLKKANVTQSVKKQKLTRGWSMIQNTPQNPS